MLNKSEQLELSYNGAQCISKYLLLYKVFFMIRGLWSWTREISFSQEIQLMEPVTVFYRP